jgi:hypothetical protein
MFCMLCYFFSMCVVRKLFLRRSSKGCQVGVCRRRAAKVGGALYDEAPSAWVAEEFRTRYKAEIQTIIARTAGRIMASTGIPGTFSGQGGPRRRQLGT